MTDQTNYVRKGRNEQTPVQNQWLVVPSSKQWPDNMPETWHLWPWISTKQVFK